ncbi:MAG TPA: hypothetical protein DCR55_02595 [Lentisphaeria bacterium]|nr:hypothetical protein [Lentisphaeria bacterium]
MLWFVCAAHILHAAMLGLALLTIARLPINDTFLLFPTATGAWRDLMLGTAVYLFLASLCVGASYLPVRWQRLTGSAAVALITVFFIIKQQAEPCIAAIRSNEHFIFVRRVPFGRVPVRLVAPVLIHSTINADVRTLTIGHPDGSTTRCIPVWRKDQLSDDELTRLTDALQIYEFAPITDSRIPFP